MLILGSISATTSILIYTRSRLHVRVRAFKSKGASCNNKSGGSVQRTTRTSIDGIAPLSCLAKGSLIIERKNIDLRELVNLTFEESFYRDYQSLHLKLFHCLFDSIQVKIRQLLYLLSPQDYKITLETRDVISARVSIFINIYKCLIFQVKKI
ncbi:hypothetical protein PUN28_018568 [Cardiocondyla obscurior]|uniref:Uncharacterized protein n=1 Tax=Cardiocondyla obscurior TaxID=286306 RepID=A0AAW2EEG9_9HYME